MSTLSHGKRLLRRRELAQRVRDGATVEDVAIAYNVNPTLVRTACREHSVRPSHPRRADAYRAALMRIAHNQPIDPRAEACRVLGLPIPPTPEPKVHLLPHNSKGANHD